MNQENKANEEKWKLEFAESRRCFEELRKPTQKQIWGYRQGALDGFIEVKRSSQVEIDKLCEENEKLRELIKKAKQLDLKVIHIVERYFLLTNWFKERAEWLQKTKEVIGE